MTAPPHDPRYVLSVLVADRVGILSAITTAVTDLGANIEGISQTVVQGYFTVILVAAFRGAVTAEQVRQAIVARFREGEASVVVRPYEPGAQAVAEGDRYILTMFGKDRAGILKTVTTYLAEKRINVEDLYFLIEGELVTHVGEVAVPRLLDIKQVQDELRELMAPIGLTVCLQHENLFRATNEVGSIRQLLAPP